MTPYLGDFLAAATVHVPWSSNGADGASITRATDGSIKVYKDASTTERSSSAGVTDTEDFDALTGVHWVTLDLSDNTDSGFYAAGHNYTVVLAGAVIDGKTVNVPLATFSIQNRYTSSTTAREDYADTVLTRGITDLAATIKAAPQCLGGVITILMRTWKVVSGVIKWQDETGVYDGTNSLSRTIAGTDNTAEPISDNGDIG